MNPNTPNPSDNSWESDPVWKLLDQAPPVAAGPRFAVDTVRAARLLAPARPWWSRLLAPVPLAGLAAGAAAIALAVISLPGPKPETHDAAYASLDSPEAEEIQDIAEAETLIAAADRLDDYSDNELVRLIGF